ncbi:MAG: S-layer homology domain-containing protein [Lachnospiraceae bacterium]
MNKMMWKWKRPAAFLLAAAMIFTMPGVPASAVEAGASAVHTGLCEHHPEHTEDCGYTKGTEGAACEHEHTEDCYTPVKKCIHEHDESCYPALEESISENTATPSEAEKAQPTACTHKCSEENGCITKELNCPHERGEHAHTCGYIPATEGTPCRYTCEQCNSQDSGLVPGVSGNAPAECICETRCEKEAINPDCPVCAAEDADLTACKGTAEAACICEKLCGADDVNPDCTVCSAKGADLSVCLGKEEAVLAVQALIDALPETVTEDNATEIEEQLKAIDAEIEALTDEQAAKLDMTRYNAVCAALAAFALPQAVHTHCICAGTAAVNGHDCDSIAWTATDSLPTSAGNYYLTQPVSSDWTVPTGEVNLCLNGQTINGKITVGSGATLTLTDCSGSGKVQGEVTVNGGKFELYDGTITGGVQVGMKGGKYQTGSAFTMYGGSISGNTATGGVFLVGTTNQTAPPSFTMHGGTISNNTAAVPDGGGGGVYVGEKCSFTMDGGAITGNTATAGNGGGIYIHFNAGRVSISNATITDNKATAMGDIRYGHGGGIYSERGVTVGNVKITGNNSTFEGGGIYGKGSIKLTDATVTDNNQYDVYYGGEENSAPELTVSGSVKAGYYANWAWKLPILVSGELSADSVIRVGVFEGTKPGYGESLAIAEPASGVTLRAENFKADAADSVTSLGEDGKVYLSPCNHEMDDTGYTCKKCHTQFDARIGEGAYYQTLTEAFLKARDGSTITLMRDLNLNKSCSASDSTTLDLHGKTITSGDKFFNVNKKLTVKDSSEGGGTQALNVKFSVGSNGTLAVDDSYTGEISRVALQAGGALEAYTGTIQELRLEKGNGTGYSVKLWKDNAHCCTVKTITLAEKADQNLTVGGLLKTNHAKCELYGERDGTWSIVDKSTKIVNLTGYTAYKVQFAECVHQCDNDTVEKPVCSKCGKVLVVKIKATASDGKIKTAWFPADSGIENGDGYVEAIQTLNGWSAEGYTDATLMPLCDVHDNRGGIGIANVTLTGKLAVDGGKHLIYSTTIASGADVTFKTGRFYYITVNGKASFVGGTYQGQVTASSGAEAVFSGGEYKYLKVEDGGTAVVKNSAAFGEDVEVKGTLTVEGGSFGAAVVVERDGTMNVNGGSFTGTEYDKVKYLNGGKGTVSGGSFADLYLYGSGTAWLAGGSFTKLTSSAVLSSLLTDGAAYYEQSGNAISNSGVLELNNVTVKTHTHTVDEQTGICSVCKKQMAASLTVGGTTSWYTAFATAVEAANAADGEKTITLYQDVNGYVDGHSTTYELTSGPVTLATGGKRVTRANLIAKGISLTVTGSNGDFYVMVDGRDAELTVNDGNTKLAVTAQNGGKLSLSNGTFSRVAVKDDGSSASLSGGSYDEIEGGTGYVKAYALLAKGYAYKKTADNKWLPNANSISEKVTVEKAPFAVEKIYPNSDTDYTGNSAFATDGNIKLTAVIAPETEGVTYYYWWELFIESKNDWTITFSNVNTATHTGGKSKTLTISGLPTDKSYQYRILVQCSNGYTCYSKPFTVSTCAHGGDKTLQYDETHHWYVCGKCGAKFDRAEHSGGTATCTAKAVCSTCQTAYGELGGHTLTKYDAVDATCIASGNVEYWHCSVCGKNFSDSIGTRELTEITSPALNHKWGKWTSNGNGTHTRTCQRDSRHTETENCSGGSATCTNAAICTSCGGSYGKELGHDWGEWENTGDAQQHTRTCQRDQSHTETAAHTPGTPANCTTPQTCTACGYEITPANNNHDWNAWESNGNGTHTHTCKNNSSHTETTNCSGGSATCEARAVCDVCHMVYGELAPHTLTHTPAVDATCTTPGNVEYWHCSVCGKNFSDSEGKGELTEITSPALNHNWGAWEKVSETQHQRICQNDDSHKETGDHTPGTAATCKAPANCSICGQSYGEKNPSNHTGGTEVRNQKEATTTTEGYTGDTYCLGCGEKIASGTVIPKKTSGGSSSGGSGSGGGSSSGDSDDSDNNDNTNQPEVKPQAPVTGETKPIQPDKNGNAAVDNSSVQSAIDKAKQDAKKNGTAENRIAVTVPITQTAGQTSFNVTIKAQTLDLLVKENVRQFTVATDHLVSVNIGMDTLKQLDSVSAGGDIILRADKVDALRSTEAKAAIGTRPAYDLSLVYLSGGKETPITTLGGHTVSVRLPYTPAKGEQTGNLYAVYVDDAGKVEWITKSSYDASQKAVVFETGHFSIYGIGYKNPAPAFTDITGHWAADNILFVASRGLLSGTSDTTFSPDTGMTRGMFVTALGRLAGINPDSYKTGKFTDVKADAYYAPYVNWAAQTGIVTGVTATTFAPDTNINRELMAVIMKNYAAKLGYDLPQTLKAVTFADNANISSWAKDAVRAMQQAGILAGKNGNKFDPKGTATRAEVATVLRRFVEIVIDPQTANGWQQNDSGQWSYYRNGKPVKGWLSDDQKWYWLVKATGMMFAGGWKQIDGKWYYFYPDGTMAVNTTIDGYTIGPDGARK